MTNTADRFEVVVVGAGIAGASIAAELALTHQVLLLERESHPGYHTTGRSAAIYVESYGNAVVRALTSASRSFFANPPSGFTDGPLWSPRGNLHIASHANLDHLEAVWKAAIRWSNTPKRISQAQALSCVPVLRPEAVAAAFIEPDTMDLDVDRIHRGYLRLLAQRGGRLQCDAEVTMIDPIAGGWTLTLQEGRRIVAGTLVNAAGAWADQLAQMAGVAQIGLVPKRRTALIVDGPPDIDTHAWPMVVDAAEQFYFKPEAGKLFVSPADATPSPPCDAQPEELDIAIAMHNMSEATTLPLKRIEHRWAGLRSFVADESPVSGYAPDCERYFWFAAQGGYGIQLAPAFAMCAAAMFRRQSLPEDIRQFGIDLSAVSPGRSSLKI
jgi:D-arginine dehydrogenase